MSSSLPWSGSTAALPGAALGKSSRPPARESAARCGAARLGLDSPRIDGASSWERFRYITLPLMRGPSLIVLTLSVIYTLNVFEIILVITGGGPGAATSVVTYYAYQQGFNFLKLGPASAVTVLVFLVLAVISAIYIRLLSSSEKS